jgi:hypothetical protein
MERFEKAWKGEERMNKEQQRFQAAVAAMQALIGNPEWNQCHWDVMADAAVDAADELLSRLDRKATVKESLTAQPNADGWHRHIPGDPMPDIKAERIEIMTRDGSLNSGNPKYFDFGISFGDDSDEIVAWRAAE